MVVSVGQCQVEPPQAPMRLRSSVTVVPGKAPSALYASSVTLPDTANVRFRYTQVLGVHRKTCA